MKWLIDAYRANGKIVLWMKDEKENIRREFDFHTTIYLERTLNRALKRFFEEKNVTPRIVTKKNYLSKNIEVLEVDVPDITEYERFIEEIERKSKHTVLLYNADIPPEQQFLYKYCLKIGCGIEIEEIPKCIDNDSLTLKRCTIEFDEKSITLEDDDGKRVFRDDVNGTSAGSLPTEDINSAAFPKGATPRNAPEHNLECSSQIGTSADENNVRTKEEKFQQAFNILDPDVIIIRHAFARLPVLEKMLSDKGIESTFHRWDRTPIKYKGGKTFFSYGNVIFRDYAIRLKGRFLIDTTSVIGNDCDIEGIIELCRLTGARIQQIASRSYGAVFQHSLVRLMYEKNILIPYKEKPVDLPISMLEMLTSDSAGQRLDPKTGYHEDVAEIDFSSMFPWIIYNKNISAETILDNNTTAIKVPGLSISINDTPKGFVPLAIKPILDARMEYKKNPTAINNERSKALKFVLVTAYGYLRFREFKLGIASSHMAICAYAREIILSAAKMAEERGFTVVHGIVDSLFLKKKNINEEEIKLLCKDIEAMAGIPVALEGIFKWIVFLPSINDIYRPLPATYYGVFKSGTIKCRGIEARQRKVPQIVRHFQERIVADMTTLSKKDILEKIPQYCARVRKTLEELPKISGDALAYNVRISKTEYKNDVAQRAIINSYKTKGITLYPGQTIRYVYQGKGRAVLPEDYNRKPDKKHYEKLLIRSLYNIFSPFGVTRQEVIDWAGVERQTKIFEFVHVKEVGIPLDINSPKDRLKLSEKIVRRKLEREGWIVWRGDLVNILRHVSEIYPNVRKKYELMTKLFEKYHPGKLEEIQYIGYVHHGLPDFICFKDGLFKFVECKLGYEQLMKGQKKTVAILRTMGFNVEVHKLINPQTKTIKSFYNPLTGVREVIERQAVIG